MTPLVSKALELAERAHSGQLDKQLQPYINHCVAVMQQFEDELLQIIALLHDTVEDTWVTYFDLAELFPLEVVHAIEYLTRRKTYGERYNEYIRRVAENPLARAVKIADLKHNISRLSGLPASDRTRLAVRYEWALEYLEARK